MAPAGWVVQLQPLLTFTRKQCHQPLARQRGPGEESPWSCCRPGPAKPALPLVAHSQHLPNLSTAIRGALSPPPTWSLLSDLFLGSSAPGPVPGLQSWVSPGPGDLLPATAFLDGGSPPVQAQPACLAAQHLSPAAWPVPGLMKLSPGTLPNHSKADTLTPLGLEIPADTVPGQS